MLGKILAFALLFCESNSNKLKALMRVDAAFHKSLKRYGQSNYAQQKFEFDLGYGNNRGKNRGRKPRSDRDGGSNFGGSARRFTGGYGRTGGGGGYGGGSSGPRSSSFGPTNAPVEVGKEYSVTITDLSRRGEGVAKVQGFIIFIPGGKPSSNEVKVKIERVSARFASASLVGGGGAAETAGTEGEEENSESGFDDDNTVPEGGSQDLVESL